MRIADPEKLPRILEAATRLFAERPFQAVHMKEIADCAEVAKGTLYLHFKDKEALFRAMIVQVSAQRLDETQGRVAGEPDPHEKLRILIRDAVQFSALYPHYLETLYHLDGNPAQDEDTALRRRRERLFVLIEEILVTMENPSVVHPDRATLALLGMMHRVMIFTPSPWPDDLADWITDQFLFGATGTGERREQGSRS
ncbi:transcriptional regulator, TetR family [Singulisphaera sp. GP187]|uniref:TetR/AcrR family transcriptional regulator n=1 Tax=Singulisphaera sp. GP187 TaxID=1882752 RepID=UPI000925ED7B|nr:TetR/AcrR family transcriptional regulator [Singulisphaera sp. GP187]SIO56829.1 transcriptional regulator, TetR family [Singulisphaera sp. GP187]